MLGFVRPSHADSPALASLKISKKKKLGSDLSIGDKTKLVLNKICFAINLESPFGLRMWPKVQRLE